MRRKKRNKLAVEIESLKKAFAEMEDRQDDLEKQQVAQQLFGSRDRAVEALRPGYWTWRLKEREEE